MATVTKPPLLDETGQKILAVLTSGLADIVDAIGGEAGGEPKLAGAKTMSYDYNGSAGVAGVATYEE